jgi:serine/threonine-protein kinase RsbW
MVHESDRAGGPRLSSAAVGEGLRLELGAGLAGPSIVRTRLRRWLDELGWPSDEAEDIVLAVYEAVANAVDHAYRPGEPGPVRVSARAATGGNGADPGHARIELHVRDEGRWRPADADPGHRGHGLVVMRGCMDTVDVTAGDGGTEVRMLSRGVALEPPLLRDAGGGNRHEVHAPATPRGSRPRRLEPAPT